MIDSLFLQPNYVAAKKMLDATALRHEAIASNLANIETPHYRRVDVNPAFSTELQQAIAAKDPDRMASLRPALAVDQTAISSRRDGNTVELDAELINLNQNTLAHTLETQLVTGALLRLRLAITGRPAG
jgi:flagellar basal-body rod protein FlgB